MAKKGIGAPQSVSNKEAKALKKAAPSKKVPVGQKTGAGEKASAVKKLPGEKAAKQTKKPGAPLYSFRISLKGISPTIWRKFFVPSDISLEQFTDVLLSVMGWMGTHLYLYTIYGETYENADSDDFMYFALPASKKTTPLSKVKLNKLGLAKGVTFSFEYDFGDGWEHTIKVLDTDYQPKESGRRYGCLSGKRACPPEDCGGPWGYRNLLEILSTPTNSEYEEMLEWVGDDFDPEYFSAEETTLLMSL